MPHSSIEMPLVFFGLRSAAVPLLSVGTPHFLSDDLQAAAAEFRGLRIIDADTFLAVAPFFLKPEEEIMPRDDQDPAAL